MATLEIEGRKVEVDDSFLKLAPDEQSKTVDEIATSLKIGSGAPQDKTGGLNDIVRSAASGVPGGGLLNKIDAATNALLAPVIEPLLSKGPNTLDQPTFGERYNKSLDIQNRRDERMAAEHPIIDTAAKLAGGVGSFGAAAARIPGAAKALGFEGTISQMVTKGATSGALISGADAATRGQDAGQASGEGAILGAAAGPVGRVVGKAAGKVASMVRATPEAVPHSTINVGGVDVPVPPLDTDSASKLEIARRGGAGVPAQKVVEEFDAQAADRLRAASDKIASELAGSDAAGGARPATAQEAADRVSSELGDAEQTRFQTERSGQQRATAEGEGVRQGLATDPYTGRPITMADSPYAAAEQVGGAVARERGAAQRGVQQNYREATAVPGEFDPSVPRSMAEEIRARANTGEEPLWIDPQTTSAGNTALKLLDETLGNGLFHNAAAPTPGAAGAAAGAAEASDAERAFAELTAKGVSPERARAAVANVPGAERIGAGREAMSPHSVAVPGGGSVEVAPKVVEAASLKGDPTLQPRDRSRAASTIQINDMAKNLNPERLGVSSEADRGAPIIGPDQIIESGNGRVAAIRQAYAENGPAADRYRQWLASQGVDVSKYKQPVMVRERVTPMNSAERRAFTVASNQSSTLSLSAAERALADSRALTPETLGLIQNHGDLGAVENRGFVRQFLAGIPQAEHGALVTKGGDLSAEGLGRVRNAVLAKAYGDTPVLARIAESTRDEVKSISSGLVSAAPEWAQLRAAVAAGHVPKGLDATADLLDAVERTARLRGKGTSLGEGLAQRDVFTPQSPESEAFMRMFYDADGARAAPASQVGNALRSYAQEALKVDAAPGLDLGMPAVGAKDILASTAAKVGAPKELAAEVKAAAAAAPVKAEVAAGSPVGMREIDAARKRLNVLRGDAIKEAMKPGGSGADLRAINRIIQEFDNVIRDAHAAGKFSGDSGEAQRLIEKARRSHSEMRQTFSSRGGSDPVGRAVEKILGRYTDSAATPDEIAKLSYGPAANPGGGAAARVAQRLRSILGASSPEWGAYKQGLFDHVRGTGSPAEQADRIEKFLTGSEGRILAQTGLSGEERAAMAAHAENLRASVPTPLSEIKGVDRIVARITGRDGGVPATTGEVVNYIFGTAKTAGSRGDSVRLAQRLKKDMSPEGFDQVRQGLWNHLTERPAGIAEWTHKQAADNIFNFLDREISQIYYSPAERGPMRSMAEALRAHAPIPGTTNPSGTAPMLSKIAGTTGRFVLPLVGLAHGGLPGAIAGEVGQRALSSAKHAGAARQTKRLLYEGQPVAPVDPRFAKAGALLTRGAMQGRLGDR